MQLKSNFCSDVTIFLNKSIENGEIPHFKYCYKLGV